MNVDNIPLILSLDVAGNPHRWITYQDAAYYYAKGLIAWSMGGDDHRLRGGIQRITGNQSILDINTIIAIKGMGVSRLATATPPLSNRALFRRDQNLCAYCGEEFTCSKLSRDHVHPRSRGGQDVWTNVVTACTTCNKHKDNKTPEEAQMPLLYYPYAPNRAEWLILHNRNILCDQMGYLLSRVPTDSRLIQ